MSKIFLKFRIRLGDQNHPCLTQNICEQVVVKQMEKMMSKLSKGGMKGHAQMGRDALKMDEMRMSKAMMAAKASDFDLLWAKKMIAHHQGAIDMSQSLLKHGGDADAKRMAQMTIDENTKAKADLEAFVRKHGG